MLLHFDGFLRAQKKAELLNLLPLVSSAINEMNSNLKRLYVELAEVAKMLTLSEATIQKMVRESSFPAPRQLSGRRVGWLLREIEVWAENRPVSDLPPPLNTGKRRSANSRS